MNWQNRVNTLHRRAMEHVDTAHYYESLSDSARSRVERQHALELEAHAVEVFKAHSHCEPTLTVLLRSAAALALQCGELDRAERMAAMALLGEGPEALKQDARDIVRAVRLARRGHRVQPRVAPRPRRTRTLPR